jgi:hypothetical protein
VTRYRRKGDKEGNAKLSQPQKGGKEASYQTSGTLWLLGWTGIGTVAVRRSRQERSTFEFQLGDRGAVGRAVVAHGILDFCLSN